MEYSNFLVLLSIAAIFILAGCSTVEYIQAIASGKGQTKTMKALISKGAYVKAKVDLAQGKTVLMMAAMAGYTENVKLLLDACDDVNAKDSEGWTSLMYAPQKGYTETVKALLSGSTVINFNNNHGQTASMLAAIENHFEIVELLDESEAK